ncbi:TonB-dependent receptor [Acaryochloris sp. IP29b_bin.148]|uniref:TonB-dependent receptor domain-containing protein n=1 Tax=Acaryochloris sp. IP29b_bin.148 TaxID=2969218 RepID=UPI002607F234|nr:TonB-dependent receptor [Acaryochloris sp. IP29b_bin.148]
MRNLFTLGKYLGAGAAVALIAQPAYAQVISITDVQLVPTEQGLELVLEVPSGTELEVSSSRTGNTFIADISNTQLILPGGKPFEQANPVPGVSAVSVIPISSTQVRVTVVSEQEGLVTEVNQNPQSLVFNVATSSAPDNAPPTDSTQTPDPAEASPGEAPPPSLDGQEPTGDPDTTSQTPAATDPPEVVEDDELEIVVTATRTEEDPLNVPRSVTVIKRSEIEQEGAINNDLDQILGKFVPGLGPPTAGGRTRVLDLRGRPAQILIDGVPQNSNTGFGTELSAIDPSAIERIEVVRGASAIYGEGASGGVINIITRSPLEEDGQKVRLGLTLRPNFEKLSEDGFGYRVDAGVTAKEGKVDFLVDTAFDIKGATFSGEGFRIPPTGLNNDNSTINVLTKVGIDISEEQRLQLSYNFFNNVFDSEFISDPPDDDTGDEGARALRVGRLQFNSGNRPRQTVHNVNVTYRHQDVFGSEVNAQAFLRKTDLNQIPVDLRNNPNIPPFVFANPFLPALNQTSLDALEVGGRFQVDTPVTDRFSILWGADLSYEENEQVFLESDTAAFDNTRELNVFRTFNQTPFYKLRNIGTFAQLTWDATDNLTLSGGLRYENIRLDVDDYTGSPFRTFGAPPLAEVEGGTLTVDDVVFNAGVVFKATDQVSLYGNFSQGFSLPSVGTALGLAPNDSNFADIIQLEPQKVNNYELGVRGNFDNLTLSLAGFLSTSSLGSTLVPDATGFSRLVRAPQRNYGVEFAADWQPSDRWRLGTTFSWNEGSNNPDGDDDDRFVPLSSVDVQPFKATAYLENETLPGWRNRLQALFVGGRDRAFDAGVDQFQVTGYTLVDFFSTINIGPGKLQLGIQNLFDRQYLPVSSQERFGVSAARRFPGEGRTYSIRYSLEF